MNATSYGTSHFVSQDAAVEYYIDYVDPGIRKLRHSIAKERTRSRGWYMKSVQLKRRMQAVHDEVISKLENGEIHLGMPDVKPGDKLSTNDEGRYVITPGK